MEMDEGATPFRKKRQRKSPYTRSSQSAAACSCVVRGPGDQRVSLPWGAGGEEGDGGEGEARGGEERGRAMGMGEVTGEGGRKRAIERERGGK